MTAAMKLDTSNGHLNRLVTIALLIHFTLTTVVSSFPSSSSARLGAPIGPEDVGRAEGFNNDAVYQQHDINPQQSMLGGNRRNQDQIIDYPSPSHPSRFNGEDPRGVTSGRTFPNQRPYVDQVSDTGRSIRPVGPIRPGGELVEGAGQSNGNRANHPVGPIHSGNRPGQRPLGDSDDVWDGSDQSDRLYDYGDGGLGGGRPMDGGQGYGPQQPPMMMNPQQRPQRPPQPGQAPPMQPQPPIMTGREQQPLPNLNNNNNYGGQQIPPSNNLPNNNGNNGGGMGGMGGMGMAGLNAAINTFGEFMNGLFTGRACVDCPMYDFVCMSFCT